jgi:hypothetical protein
VPPFRHTHSKRNHHAIGRRAEPFKDTHLKKGVFTQIGKKYACEIFSDNLNANSGQIRFSGAAVFASTKRRLLDVHGAR